VHSRLSTETPRSDRKCSRSLGFLALNVDSSYIISAYDIARIVIVNFVGHMLMPDYPAFVSSNTSLLASDMFPDLRVTDKV